MTAAHTKEDDWVEHLFIASTHDYVMFFTQSGQCYWLKVHEIPQAARAARGKPIVNCVAIKPDERIAALVPVREFSEDQFLFFATREGRRSRRPGCRSSATRARRGSTRSTSRRATS